jgi:5'-nucleotidase
MVVSGINDGENLGDDVLYSGTVAAAMEGRFLGKPAVAFSLQHDGTRERHYDTAAHFARQIVERLIAAPIDPSTILSVNVPNLPLTAVKGVQVTRLGNRHRSAPVVPSQDPRGRAVYWVGPPGQGQDAGPGTDFHALAHGFVSVTPLSVDLTRHHALTTVADWLDLPRA